MSRMDRVNQLIKQEISCILQREMEDPHLSFVTIVHVAVSRDLRNAKVGYSVLGDNEHLESIQDSLDRASGYIRGLLGKRVQLRYTPKLLFAYDQSIAYSARIDKTIEEIKEENSLPDEPQDSIEE